MYDALNDREVVLSKEELEIIRNIRKGKSALGSKHSDPFPDYVPYFTGEKRVEQLGDGIEPKRRFIPSKWEAKKVTSMKRRLLHSV